MPIDHSRTFPRRSVRLAFCACAVFTLSSTSGRAAEYAGRDRVALVDLQGKTTAGRLHSMTARNISLAGDATKTVPLDDLLRIEFPDGRAFGTSSDALVLLANGDRLSVKPAGMDDATLSAAWGRFGDGLSLEIPLETIRAVVLNLPESATARAALLHSLVRRPAGSDVLLLENGDRVSGELAGMDSAVVKLRTAAGESMIERRGVTAIRFSDELISFPDPHGRRFLVDLGDGSRVTAENLSLEKDGVLRLKAMFGAELAIPVAAVDAIRLMGGRAAYLSQLKPAAYVFTPYLSNRWEIEADANVLGGPLKLRGREYPRGVGVHSNSRIEYDLAGAYRNFHAVVGVDDAADRKGSVRFVVEVDGKPAFDSGVVTGRTDAKSTGSIDVSDARKLTLLVEFADHGDIRDYADWCDAVLVK